MKLPVSNDETGNRNRDGYVTFLRLCLFLEVAVEGSREEIP
jgi:hypothetical protein